MKAEKLRESTTQELNTRLAELKSQLFNLRFQQITGQLSNPMVIRECRKDIARVMTILREREIEQLKKAE